MAGMMDAAFQIGRKQLLDWLNGTFSLHLARIEETANGASVAALKVRVAFLIVRR